MLGLALLLVFVVITLRLEVLPLAVWLFVWPRRGWAFAGALAWACILLWVPLWGQIRNPVPPEPLPPAPLEVAAAQGASGAAGLVYLDKLYNTASGNVRALRVGSPLAYHDGDRRVRPPLSGLYRETSPAAEFLHAEVRTCVSHGFRFVRPGPRPHWYEAWQDVRDAPSMESAFPPPRPSAPTGTSPVTTRATCR